MLIKHFWWGLGIILLQIECSKQTWSWAQNSPFSSPLKPKYVRKASFSKWLILVKFAKFSYTGTASRKQASLQKLPNWQQVYFKKSSRHCGMWIVVTAEGSGLGGECPCRWEGQVTPQSWPPGPSAAQHALPTRQHPEPRATCFVYKLPGGDVVHIYKDKDLGFWDLKPELFGSHLYSPPEDTSTVSAVHYWVRLCICQLLSPLKSKHPPYPKSAVLVTAINWARCYKISLMKGDLPEFSQFPLY